jgi:hypothetical protein
MGHQSLNYCTNIQYFKILGNFRIIEVGNMSTSSFTFGEDEEEYLLEREAIAEFDGGLTREDARNLAYKCYVNKYRSEFKSYYPLPLSQLAGGVSTLRALEVHENISTI